MTYNYLVIDVDEELIDREINMKRVEEFKYLVKYLLHDDKNKVYIYIHDKRIVENENIPYKIRNEKPNSQLKE